MINSYKVIVCTPVGRKETLNIMVKYMLSLTHVVDEWQLWMNVRNDTDIDYINSVANNNSEFIKQVYKLPKNHPEYATNSALRYFYNDCTDSNTIYVKMDDDIVYIDIEGFMKYLQFRADNPQYFLVNPVIVNNIFISWKLANLGLLPDFPHYSPAGENLQAALKNVPQDLNIFDESLRIAHVIPEHIVLDKTYWGNTDFAVYIHNKFLENPELFKIQNWELTNYEIVSIHCISWIGSAFKNIVGKISPEDEPWLQTLYPRSIGLKNIVFGDCVVSHYSYHNQHALLNKSDILDKYTTLSKIELQTQQ